MTPTPEPVGLKFNEQLATETLILPMPQALLPPLKLPEALLVLLRLNRTGPVGVTGVGELSVTETVHVEV